MTTQPLVYAEDRAPEAVRQLGRTASGVSLIFVSYNSGAYLERCLGTLPRDPRLVDIIVVDNASPDGSADRIERAFPHVRVIRNRTNGGFGQGNNIGARWARGEYLAFLNPDTIVEPGWLEPLIDALERNPDVGLATSKIVLLADPGTINTCGGQVHCSGLTLCRGMGDDRRAFEATDNVVGVSGAAFVIRRGLFRALGGFDESFFMYQEDTDLSWRARLAGYRSVCVPASVVHHDYTLRFGPRKVFYQERNRYLMLVKSLRWSTLAALLPALLLAELVTWGFVVARQPRQAAGKLAAYWWLVRNWRQIAVRRRATQRLRRASDRELLAACSHRLAFEQTGSGVLARAAHLVFDPLFLVLHRLALTLVRR